MNNKMGRFRVVQELRNQACPGPRDQRVAILEQDFEIKPPVGAGERLQLEQRGRENHRNLAAETRRSDHQIDVGR